MSVAATGFEEKLRPNSFIRAICLSLKGVCCLRLSGHCWLLTLRVSSNQGRTKSWSQYKSLDLFITFQHSFTSRLSILQPNAFQKYIFQPSTTMATEPSNPTRTKPEKHFRPRILPQESQCPKALVYDPSKPDEVTEEAANEENRKPFPYACKILPDSRPQRRQTALKSNYQNGGIES